MVTEPAYSKTLPATRNITPAVTLLLATKEPGR